MIEMRDPALLDPTRQPLTAPAGEAYAVSSKRISVIGSRVWELSFRTQFEKSELTKELTVFQRKNR